MNWKRKASVVVLLVISSVLVNAADCQRYFGRGYCTDWVQQRTGRRQSGDAGTWRGNVATNQGRVGDVLIFRGINHVAVVEGVVYQANTSIVWGYDVSEMNYSATWVDRACLVTTNFGKLTRRRVPIGAVSAVWHP